jgi:hypothetical protein
MAGKGALWVTPCKIARRPLKFRTLGYLHCDVKPTQGQKLANEN